MDFETKHLPCWCWDDVPDSSLLKYIILALKLNLMNEALSVGSLFMINRLIFAEYLSFN